MMRNILLASCLVFACVPVRAAEEVAAQEEQKAPVATDLVIGPLVFFNRVPQDPGEALAFYRKIAGQGNLHAQMNLGFLLAEGKAVPQDFAEAFSWFSRAASQGNATAQMNLAIMHDEGLGTRRDPAQAVIWYRKAADRGNARAQYEIGRSYERKALEEVQAPALAEANAEAVKWYRKSADQGYAKAQNALGVLYFRGTGVRQDSRQAIGWCRMAADSGEPDAAYELGTIYKSISDGSSAMSGHDLLEAHKWLGIAISLWQMEDADNRNNEGYVRGGGNLLRIIEAKTALDALARKMTQGEIDAAQEQAREWVDTHFPGPSE